MSFFSQLFSSAHEGFVLPERRMNPLFITDPVAREEYCRKGYTILRNIADDESIGKIIEGYNKITQLPEYKESQKFQSSLAYGKEAFDIGVQTVNEVSARIFATALDHRLCKYDMGGSILMKNKGCYLGPHQGASLIDEYKGVTTYAWVPTVDITMDNGTFYVLEGSHLWAAWQRSSQMDHWPFLKFEKLLWNHMKPLLLKKGDVLLFDSALIHASGENTTGKIRLAINVCILEKDIQYIQYAQEKDTPKGMIEKYLVDEKYWYAGNFAGRPQGYERVIEKKIYPTHFNDKFILKQIEKYTSA